MIFAVEKEVEVEEKKPTRGDFNIATLRQVKDILRAKVKKVNSKTTPMTMGIKHYQKISPQ